MIVKWFSKLKRILRELRQSTCSHYYMNAVKSVSLRENQYRREVIIVKKCIKCGNEIKL